MNCTVSTSTTQNIVIFGVERVMFIEGYYYRKLCTTGQLCSETSTRLKTRISGNFVVRIGYANFLLASQESLHDSLHGQLPKNLNTHAIITVPYRFHS